MKKKILSIIFLLSICLSLIPVFSNAATSTAPVSSLNYSGWVQCDGVVAKDKNGNLLEPARNIPCNFANLISMVKYLINWAFALTIPVMIGLITYSGFLYLTGVEKNITKAKEMMLGALKGFIIALLAWFIVTTILKLILKSEFLQVTGTLIEQQK